MNGISPRRLWALIRKEVRQIVRDPSSIAMGVVLPLVLILLFGFGLSLDVKNEPVAVVLGDGSAQARIFSFIEHSHTAAPELLPNVVVRNGRARHFRLDH